MDTLVERMQARIARNTRRLFEPVPGVVLSAQARLGTRPVVAYVSDGAGWVLDEVGYRIAERIRDRYLMRVVTSHRGYRGCIVHFAAPPIYLKNEAYESVHPSNRLLLTWTHGLPGNPDPNIQLQLANMRRGEPYLSRIKVQTTTARDYLIGQGVRPEKIVHIPLGVDTARFCPPNSSERAATRSRLGVPEGAICIGSFQKDSPGWDNTSREKKWVKGPDVLVGVLKRLAEHYPLYVLLTTPSRGYVIEHLERAGIAYRHDVLSGVTDLPAYYRALDLYLITSRDEGGPMALLEAMACGIPVVSTCMGIPKDAIRHGENGLLAEIDDMEGLIANARRLLDDPAFAAGVSAGARQTALSYDWALIADKYARLLYDFGPRA
jgi:glycosyltransferase involved in cell wall biosynthesis